METAQEMWQSFALGVLPPDAPHVQRVEMRRAFMAGCWGVLQAMRAVGEPEVSEEQGMRYFEDLKAELERFYEDVKNGKA